MKRLVLLAVVGLALTAAPNPARAEFLIGLTTANTLVTFDSATPGTVSAPIPITGVSGITLLGIDIRPANGLLYAAGIDNSTGQGQVLTINPTTGVASAPVGLRTNTNPALNVTLAGTSFGVDFNPVPDRLRLTSDADQNLRINVADGTTTVDGAINPAVRNIVASAYANNFPGATSTTLYGLDSTANQLFIQNPPNDGTQVAVGTGLGVDFSDAAGFDISGLTGVAYAALNFPTGIGTNLYTINLSTGAATLVGGIGGNVQLRGLAAPRGTGPLVTGVPAPAGVVLFAGMGALMAGGAIRRRKVALAA